MEFKPKDWFLVRDDNEEPWRLNIFSHKEDDECFVCVSSWYAECIPYEGNEHLLGKKDAPEEKEEFKFGDKVEIEIDGEWCEAVVVEIDNSSIPYKVATPDGDINWRRRGGVRRA